MAEIKKRRKNFFTVKTIFAIVALAVNMIGRLFSLLSVYFENIDYIFNSQNDFDTRLKFILDLSIRGIGDHILYHATSVMFLLLIFYFGLEGLGRRRKRLIGMAFFLNALSEMVSSFAFYYYNADALPTSDILSGYFTSLISITASVAIALYGFRKLKSRRVVVVASAALIVTSFDFVLENFGRHTFMIFLTASPALIAVCGLYVLIFVHFLRERKLEERLAREAREEAEELYAMDAEIDKEPGFFDDFESTEEFDLTDEIIIGADSDDADEPDFDDEPEATEQEPENEESEEDEISPEESAPTDDGSWQCSCGNKPTTNFCGKCGSKRS